MYESYYFVTGDFNAKVGRDICSNSNSDFEQFQSANMYSSLNKC